MPANLPPYDPNRVGSNRPYGVVGSGQLASMVWKNGSEALGWEYRFNVFRMSNIGDVGQEFAPHDLKYFVRLIQVLANCLAEDGCLPPAERQELADLAQRLDKITRPNNGGNSSLN